MPAKTKTASPKKHASATSGFQAGREMSRDEQETTKRFTPTSTFKIQPLNFTLAFPSQHYTSTQIPACRWFRGKNESAGKCRAASELALAT